MRQLISRAVLEMLEPYAAALYIAERLLESPTFEMELAQSLRAKLLPLERIADDMLRAASQRRYFQLASAEPLLWLESCHGQVKDCMVAFEAMLDPNLDDLMASAMEEYQCGETLPLDSIQ